ncbi:hypothetical protein [Paracoccus sp. TOH]|nr:hypothetical protein [Paracoccus sp. TOH]
MREKTGLTAQRSDVVLAVGCEIFTRYPDGSSIYSQKYPFQKMVY